MNRLQRITSLIAGFGLMAAAVLPAQQGAALGANGEIYFAKTGTYKSLFPQGNQVTPASNDVLALEIVRPGEPTQRLLVPETDGTAIELSPSLLYEESSHTLFLLWESRINRMYPVLMVAGYDGERWIDPVEIGDPMAMKNSPQFAITRDSYKVLEGDGEETRTRTVVHLLWGEELPGHGSQTLYTPIILENGAFTGVSPEQIYELNDLDPSAAAMQLPELPANIAAALRLQPGRDGQTVVAAFTSPETRRVVSVEIDVLPAELSLLADDARAHIIDIGKSMYPAQVKQFADGARAHIIDIGRRFFHSEIATSLADQVHSDILASNGQDDLGALADVARAHIIDIGAKLSGRGLLLTTGAPISRIVEITTSLNERPLKHLFQFRLASSRPAPAVGSGVVSLFASRSGKDLLVAWVEPERLRYRESDGDEWKKVQEIKFSASVSLDRAYEILEQRMSRR